MLGYDDKRNFFRMMLNSPCELVVSDEESTRTLQAVCKDISATGMSFEVEEESVEVVVFGYNQYKALNDEGYEYEHHHGVDSNIVLR